MSFSNKSISKIRIKICCFPYSKKWIERTITIQNQNIKLGYTLIFNILHKTYFTQGINKHYLIVPNTNVV